MNDERPTDEVLAWLEQWIPALRVLAMEEDEDVDLQRHYAKDVMTDLEEAYFARREGRYPVRGGAWYGAVAAIERYTGMSQFHGGYVSEEDAAYRGSQPCKPSVGDEALPVFVGDAPPADVVLAWLEQWIPALRVLAMEVDEDVDLHGCPDSEVMIDLEEAYLARRRGQVPPRGSAWYSAADTLEHYTGLTQYGQGYLVEGDGAYRGSQPCKPPT